MAIEHYVNQTESKCSPDLPSFCTYAEIVSDTVSHFLGNCSVWAEPPWLEDTISVYVVLALMLYIYVLVIIIMNIRELQSAFYLCALSLAVGDLMTLVTTLREGRVQSCVLRQIPARHYAWQTIGTFGMDCTLTSQLVMAVTRFTAIYTIPRQEMPWLVAKIGVGLSWLWVLAMTSCSHFGMMSKIWFENGDYKDEMKHPFQHIRLGVLLLCTVGTFVVYSAMMILTIRIRFKVQRADFTREMRMYAQCVLIFICELFFLYATFWFGYHYLHLGDCAANALVNYTIRPIAISMTPIIYVIFSTKIRDLILAPCRPKIAKKRPTISSTSPLHANEEHCRYR